jgi:hypothetical protein
VENYPSRYSENTGKCSRDEYGEHGKREHDILRGDTARAFFPNAIAPSAFIPARRTYSNTGSDGRGYTAGPIQTTTPCKRTPEGDPLSRFACTGLISPACDGELMQSQYTSCRLSCHRCSHAWTYMGIRLASLKLSGRPVKIQCPRCKARVAMEVKNAR